VVHFFATWCEPCRDELPFLVRLRDRLAGRPVVVLAVNLGEGRRRIEAFLRELSVDLPVLLDPDLRAAQAWGVEGLPTTFLVDAGGRVRFVALGPSRWRDGEPAAALERLLADAEARPVR